MKHTIYDKRKRLYATRILFDELSRPSIAPSPLKLPYLRVKRVNGPRFWRTYLYKKPRSNQRQTTVLTIESIMVSVEWKLIQIEKPEKENFPLAIILTISGVDGSI